MARLEPYVHVKEVIKDTPTRLPSDGSSNIGVTIVAPVGPKLSYVSSPSEFLKLYTTNGIDIPRDAHISFINAYYLSFFSGLVVSRSMNSDVLGGISVDYKYNKESDSYEFSHHKILMKDGVELVNKLTLSITSPSSDWGFILDDQLYYHGNLDKVAKNLSAVYDSNNVIFDFNALPSNEINYDTDSEIGFILTSLINRHDTYSASVSSGNIILHYNSNTSPSFNKLKVLTDDGDEVISDVAPYGVTLKVGNEEPYHAGDDFKPLFTLISKVPQDSDSGDIYRVKIKNMRMFKGRRVFTFSYDLTDNNWNDILLSLDKNAVDSSGVNSYIELINEMEDIPFTVSVPDDPDIKSIVIPDTEIMSFGSALISTVESAHSSNLVAALYSLEDQELYKIRYLAPVGITDIRYIRNYCSVGERNKWFCPIDIPYDRVNSNSIKQWAKNIPDSYNNYICGPFDKNQGLLGWTTYIAGTTLYWERVFNNKTMNAEFAPVFDQVHGIMLYTNPVKLLTKSARESLINQALPINYVIYSQSTGSYFMNDNWTHYSGSENVMGEENNVRLVHKISLDVQDMMQRFKSRNNTSKTRNDVTDSINLYFKTILMPQEYKPLDYKVICDESNNTDEIIAGRKLAVQIKVRLFNSIKYIDVVNEVYSVAGNFTE